MSLEWLRRMVRKEYSVADMDELLARAELASGFERQAAVEALAGRADVAVLPVLLVRANDWVPQVRVAAASALQAWLDDACIEAWCGALPELMALRRGRRADHSGLLAQIECFLSRPANLGHVVAAGSAGEREVQRFVFELRLRAYTPNGPLVGLLLASVVSADRWQARHAVARASAADCADRGRELGEAACRSPFGEVRRDGLRLVLASGMTGEDAFVKAMCFDRRAMVRDLALATLTRWARAEVTALALQGVRDGAKADVPRATCLALLRTLLPDAWLVLCREMALDRGAALRATAYQGLLAGADAEEVTRWVEQAMSDASPRVQRLAVRAVQRGATAPDALRLRQLVQAVESPRTLMAGLQLAARLSPWDRGWFALVTLADVALPASHRPIAHEGVRRWCVDLQRAFVKPQAGQADRVRVAWQAAQPLLADDLRAQLAFELQAFGVL